MEQTRALNALEPFIALSKSATSPRAAADLISQATSASNTYVFAELLHTPNIQALRQSEEHAKSLQLLEIFAWGTWADYQGRASTLPKLNAQQEHKLRLLTLLTLAALNSPDSSTLTYTYLISALSLESQRELEDLITAALYAGLVTASLDPLHGHAIISAIAPLRDIAPGSAPALLAQLQMWGGRCDASLADLESRIQKVRADAKLRDERTRRVNDVAEREKRAMTDNKNDEGDGIGDPRKVRKKGGFAGLGRFLGGSGEDDPMDLDDGHARFGDMPGRKRREP